MNSRILTAGCVLLFVLGSTSAQAPPSAARADAADRGARALLAAHLQVLDVPGLSAAVGVKGRVVWSNAVGFADLEQQVPTTRLTRFRIGSVSKTLTAAALVRLVESGRIDLDAPVQRYVPSFPDKGQPITIRQLAQHRAGIRHYANDAEVVQTRHFRSRVEALELFRDDPLLFEPGTFSYSSYGYNLLGAAMEGAAGQPFAELLLDEVFQPLGMLSTDMDDITRVIPFRARGYVPGPRGERMPSPLADDSYKWPSGGMVSTADDLVRFGMAHLQAGFLKEESLDFLFSPHASIPDEGTEVAVGWERRRTSTGRTVMMFSGNLPYGRALIAVFPKEQLAIAFAANTGGGIFFNGEELFTLAELFFEDGALRLGDEPRDIAGTWTLDIEGPRGAESWTLALSGDAGNLHGTLSLGARSFPVPVARFDGTTLRAICTPGTWIRLELRPADTETAGTWRRGLRGGEVRLMTPVR